MKILIMGGTGSVGIEVLRAIVNCGHTVFALARSSESIAKVTELGATPISGDIRQPESWLNDIPVVDTVIQMASGDINNPYWQGEM